MNDLSHVTGTELENELNKRNRTKFIEEFVSDIFLNSLTQQQRSDLLSILESGHFDISILKSRLENMIRYHNQWKLKRESI